MSESRTRTKPLSRYWRLWRAMRVKICLKLPMNAVRNFDTLIIRKLALIHATLNDHWKASLYFGDAKVLMEVKNLLPMSAISTSCPTSTTWCRLAGCGAKASIWGPMYEDTVCEAALRFSVCSCSLAVRFMPKVKPFASRLGRMWRR